MNQRMKQSIRCAVASSLLFGLIALNAVSAKPGTLADTPLFLGINVPPNIFFAIDDSGSMDWEDTLNTGTWTPGNAVYGRQYPETVIWGWTGNADWNREVRRGLCVGYNVLAYDPTVVYTPWAGEDTNGNAYDNKTLTTARTDPYFTGTVNLNGFVYFPWNDADGDGEYDGPFGFGAAADPVNDECGDVSSNAPGVDVSTLPVTLSPGDAGYPNSQQNYANWYTYYRKREFIAKKAVSELIADSSARMGLATLHNNNSVGTEVEDMNNASDKEDLLETLSEINSSGGTPLRRLLRNVGRYFDQAGSNSDHSALGFTDPSPILPVSSGGECQQNFVVLFSDGFWNGGSPGVGNEDGDNDTAWDGGSHADAFSDTLADVAMKYYETDLSSSLTNKVVPIAGVDENEAQHLVTFTVAFGIDGTLTMDPSDRTTAFTWPQPVANANTTTDDMRHAAWNGRGDFLSAKNPQELIASLQSTIAQIDDRIGTASAVTFNSNQLDADTMVFLSQFNSENWTGDLLAFDIDMNGDVATTATWEAASDLDAIADVSGRTIYTFNGTDGTTLEWANLTAAQQDDFKTDPTGALETTTGFPVANARLNFIRGDRSNEGTGYNFRNRSSRLGDIVHSGPAFVGKPSDPYPDVDPFGSSTKRYSAFVTANQSRQGIVYVGANDGMLHGFNADTGDEVLAFVPNSLFSTNVTGGLHYLTDPDYTHDYYVDLSPSVADAFVRTSPAGARDWTTVLVGGLRAGGRGYFALDVTDPGIFSNTVSRAQDVVLWEFDSSDDSDLGFSYSEPRIVKLNNDKWGVIFGNGFNSDSGVAKLFILFLEEGLDGTWNYNVSGLPDDYVKISTGSGTLADKNGLTQVTVIDTDNDFVADRVYAGDLNGQLWAFDISDSNPANWEVAYGNTTTPKPLARLASSKPITVKSAITRTRFTTADNEPNVLVVFGTGQYLTSADPTKTDTQGLYGVWDAGEDEISESDLVQQTVSTIPDPNNVGEFVRTLSNNSVQYLDPPTASGGNLGWYFNFPVSGERLIIDPVVRGSNVFLATAIPESTVCTDGGGTGWIMAVNATTGGTPAQNVFDVNNDGVIDASDYVSSAVASGLKYDDNGGLPAGLGFLGTTGKVYITGTGSTSISSSNITSSGRDASGRWSWQEVIQ